MSELTKETMLKLRSEINAALAEVAKRNGMVIGLGNATFNPDSANFKLSVTRIGGVVTEGTNPTFAKAAAEFTRKAFMFGLKPDMLGKSFTYRGVKTTVIGLMPTRRKYPVLVEQANRKPFLMVADDVVRLV